LPDVIAVPLLVWPDEMVVVVMSFPHTRISRTYGVTDEPFEPYVWAAASSAPLWNTPV